MASPTENLTPVYDQIAHDRRLRTHMLACPTPDFPWVDPYAGNDLPWQPMSGPSPDSPFGSPPFASSPLFVDIKPAQRRLTCSVVHDAWIVAFLEKLDGSLCKFPVMNFDVVATKEVISAYLGIAGTSDRIQHYTDNVGINLFIHDGLKQALADGNMMSIELDVPITEYNEIAAHWLAVDDIFNALFQTYKVQDYGYFKFKISALRDLIRHSDVTLEMPPRRLNL